MKKIFTPFMLLIFLFSGGPGNGQNTNPHQSQAPPVNPGYTFTRGLFIDCSDAIIWDIANGHSLGHLQKLHDYIQNNYIGKIILCDLEQSAVFGNPLLENALRILMKHLRSSFPAIQIGIEGSDANFFKNSNYLKVWERFGKECYPRDIMRNKISVEEIINDQRNESQRLMSEMSKFFFRVARFGKQANNFAVLSSCETAFDAFFVRYRYWNYTSSLSDMQNVFNQFKDILTLLQALKCEYNCTRSIDAEFLPTEIFNLQGWTAIDQITEIDPLADRIVLPAFTNNADRVFDISCKNLHFLTDPFSKPGSKILIGLSAESPMFSNCSQTTIPNNFLGDYLNGSTSPSGNMYSVEKKFIDKLNDAAYFCQACLCYAYTDNHFTPMHIQGNIISGMMWGPYSMMVDHSLFRREMIAAIQENSFENTETAIYDILGKKLFESRGNDKPELPPGMYISIVKKGQRVVERKLFFRGTSSD